jgi:hypothetical protein
MSHDKALSLFFSIHVPESLTKANAEKLIAALKILGERF